MRSVADTADFPVICQVSDTKDTKYNRNWQETILLYKRLERA